MELKLKLPKDFLEKSQPLNHEMRQPDVIVRSNYI